MRGVLSDSDLFVYGVVTLIAKPMVVVIDDGHAMPYAQAFEWPDGSPGLAVRLAENVEGQPILVELTHVASGRKTNIDLPFGTYLTATASTARSFETVADMLADTTAWTFADCQNNLAGDKTFSSWKVLPETSPLVENTTDVRLRANGQLVIRTFTRMNL